MRKKELEWRELDVSARIFPISTGKKYSTVFRLTAMLKEEINENKLKKAVEIALEKYKYFKVKMKFGFFWYHFELNSKSPIIRKEKGYPCKYINPKLNNGYLFKVTYNKNKLNMDTFHSLADGNSASIFFREIIYTYLELTHEKEFTKNIRATRKVEDVTIEDSYIENYDKNVKSNNSKQKAYILKGNKLKLGKINTTHEIINFEQLKKKCEENQATVTQYLAAVLIYSIYTQNFENKESKKPIKLCIPVDLRRYYQSKTLSNFFSYITMEAFMGDGKLKTFDDILNFVKEDFKRRLTLEELNKTMSGNVKIGMNPFLRTIPLLLKKILVRLSYIEIRKYTTITYSNLGKMGIIGKYRKYLDYFTFMLAPEPIEKIKCSSITFGNKLVFTFTSILDNDKIEREFYEVLKKQGIEIQFEK